MKNKEKLILSLIIVFNAFPAVAKDAQKHSSPLPERTSQKTKPLPPSITGGPISHPHIEKFFSVLKEQKRISLDLDFFPSDKKTVVDYVVDHNGFVSEARIKVSSGNPSVDLACLEAVSMLRPSMNKLPINEENRAHTIFRQDTVILQIFSDSKKTKTDDKFWIHAIPVAACIYYPESFSEDELKSEENILVLSPIDTENFDRIAKKLNKFAKRWRNFFARHEFAPREEVSRFADKVKKTVI